MQFWQLVKLDLSWVVDGDKWRIAGITTVPEPGVVDLQWGSDWPPIFVIFMDPCFCGPVSHSCFLQVLRVVVQSGSVLWQSDGTFTGPAGRPGLGDAKAVLALGRRRVLIIVTSSLFLSFSLPSRWGSSTNFYIRFPPYFLIDVNRRFRR